MKLRLLIATCILLIPTSVFAGEISFRCKVKSEYKLSTDGQLVKPDNKFYKGFDFEVERSTGKIVGSGLNNNGNYDVKVIDSGNEGSFKVVSIAQERGVAEILTIVTREKENGEMPFVFIDWLQNVVTGVCD